MEVSCSRLNVIVLQKVVATLDKYVILAFFVSLLLTMVTVIIMVKYVSYYMQQDRKRIQHNLEMQHVPRLPRQEVDESDSEFDELWSSSDEDGVFDIDIDEAGSVVSKDENLETNYVSVFSSNINLRDNDKKAHQLLINLQKKSDIIPIVSNDSLAVSLFSNLYFSETSSSIDFCNLFYSKLTESLWLRKSLILQLLNFILGLLCEMHLISQKNSMNLQAKYEQEIDDHYTVNLQLDRSISIAIGNIVNSLTDDLKTIGCNIDVKILETINNCFYSIHFDCLKCSTFEFSTIHEFIDNHELTKMQCIMDIQCYHIRMKCRILSLQKYIDINENENKNNEIIYLLKEYKNNVLILLAKLDVNFSVQEENMINQIRKYRTAELDKLLSKHERDFQSLKYKIFKTKPEEMETKTETFKQYIILLYKEYIKDKNQLIMELNNHEGMQIKMIYNRQYKSVISKITELEEEFFSSLQERCNYTPDDVLSMTNNMQTHLKEMKEKCIVIKKRVMNDSVKITRRWSELTQIIIDYIIKAVSSEFRFIKDTFKTTLQQIPMFTEEMKTNILNSVQRKFSVVVFDIVITLIEDVIKNIRPTYSDVGSKSFLCKLSDLHDDLMNNENSEYAISIDQFKWLLPSEVNLNDFPLDTFLHSYKSLIFNVLNDMVATVIDEEIEPLQMSSTKEHFDKQCEIYQNIEDFMSAEKNKVENVSESKSKQYMSRKGLSYSEKSNVDVLYASYASLLGMKETKVKEISTAIENTQLSNLLQKDKSSGIASCIAILKREISCCESNVNNDYLVKLFQCEQEYMMRRFEKKIKLLVGDKPSDNVEDAVVKKKDKGLSIKKRNTVSPETTKEPLGTSKNVKTTRRKIKK